MTKNNKGFTLVELLVVILIIGVLAAIALPMYQKAVLKSRFAALMPIGKAMADSNEAYYLEHTQYASNPQDLPVQGQEDYDDGTSVDLVSNEDYTYTIVYNENKLPDHNYIVFQKHSGQFADATMCEARDEEAGKVCLALGGTPVEGGGGVTPTWTAYLLSGRQQAGDTFASAASGGCSGDAPANVTASRSGATGTASCVNGEWVYEWTGGATYGDGSYCDGVVDYACSGATFSGDSAECDSDSENSCAYSTFSGDKSYCSGYKIKSCVGSIFSGLESYCSGYRENACSGATFSGDKSYCSGSEATACAGAEIQAGAYCQANEEGGCDGAIYTTHPDKGGTLTGCCTGDYCPAGSPKCGNWNSTTHAYDIDGTW